MSLEIDRKRFIFKTKQIWFADYPYDIKGFDRVVFRDCKNKVNIPGFSRREYTTLVIDLTQDLDTIWRNMSSGNCRKPIRRAERAGIKIKMNQNYNEFYTLYNSVRAMKKLSGSINSKDIRRYATLFIAEFNGEIVSGHGYLEDKNNMRSWVIGSKRFEAAEKDITMVANASKLIIWEAIKYAKAKGIKEFDFGGYYAGGEGKEILNTPNWFKQSFGGKVITHYIYQKDYSKIYTFARSLYQLARRVLK